MAKRRTISITKGLVAGLIGGIAGTIAKNAVERAFPPRSVHRSEPEMVTHKAGNRELVVHNRRVSTSGMHLGIGAAAGAAYGVAAEFYPAATSKQGASFGMALIALNQDNILPSMKLVDKKEQTRRERTSELVSFATYGVVTETVRRVVRRMIN